MDGTVSVDTCTLSAFDTKISIYQDSSSCEMVEELAECLAYDVSCCSNGQSLVFFSVSAGSTYFVHLMQERLVLVADDTYQLPIHALSN